MRKTVFLLAWATFAAKAPDTVNARNMRADLDFLCSDPLAGRVSMSSASDVAAQFIAAEFEKAGLSPAAHGSYFQEFPLIAYSADRERTRLSINGQALRYGADFTSAFPREANVRAQVVFAGYGITAPEYSYDDYAGIDVHGKIVLIFDHEPQETDPKSVFNGTGHTLHGQPRVKIANAAEHGAAGLLLVAEPLRKHRSSFDPQQKNVYGPGLRANAPRQALDDDFGIPWLTVNDETAVKLLASAGKTPAELQAAIDRDLKPASFAVTGVEAELSTAPANVKRGKSSNVVGLLEGSDPAVKNETVILNAHYDHLGVQHGYVYRGANDNASGTVAVMELARMFASQPTRPKRSILFIVFGSEEEGLLGSFYYVAHPLRPLVTTRADINLDMIARNEAHIPQSLGVVDIPSDTSNELNVVGTFRSPDLLKTIERANEHAQLDLSTKFDHDHDLNVLYRCDHFPFLVAGVPAVWLFGGFHPGYHEPVDTVDRLNFTKLEKVVRLAWWTAMAVADK